MDIDKSLIYGDSLTVGVLWTDYDTDRIEEVVFSLGSHEIGRKADIEMIGAVWAIKVPSSETIRFAGVYPVYIELTDCIFGVRKFFCRNVKFERAGSGYNSDGVNDGVNYLITLSPLTVTTEVSPEVYEAFVGNPPIIGENGNWFAWDVEEGEYVDTEVDAQGLPGVSPEIGENGNWYNWDVESGAYVDTGVVADGKDGAAATITVGTVTSSEPGGDADVENVGTASAAVFDFTIPRGIAGNDGEDATITVGTVTTGDPGTEVQITNVGTPTAAVFNFTIPAGYDGSDGSDGLAVELQKTATHIQWRLVGGTWADLVALADITGPKGDDGISVEIQNSGTYIQWRLIGAAEWINIVAVADITGADGQEVSLQKSATHIQWRLGTGDWVDLVALADLVGETGATGETGAAATIAVGDVTTLDAGEDATVANSGSSSAAVFDFGIPKGPKGDTGGSTLNTPPRTVAMAAYEIDLEAGEVFTKTAGADSAFTIANLILWKPFTMVLTGGGLATTMFTGYTEHWLGGSGKADYDDSVTNYLHCQVRSAGHIFLFFD